LYVRKKFGAMHWNRIAAEWDAKLKKLTAHPETGAGIAELSGTGYAGYRKVLHKNVYAVYSFNDTELRIHMFIPGMRDFKTHLMHRLLSASA
jgi:plasmid stabilization system protein ParE